MASRLEYKFRWVWVDEDGDIRGTNEEEVAEHFDNEGETIIDVHTGRESMTGNLIKEVTEIPADEDEDGDEPEAA